ncbi:MAG: response regulator [Nitrospirota bacterium]
MGLTAQLLVLADHPKLQQLYAHRLRERGFLVDVASGIDEGIVAAIVLRPRLIIAEWLLKDGHGLELTRRLRGVAAVASLPILFLLDEGAPPLALHRFDEGPVDVLPKPFSFEQLIQKVDQLTAAPGANGGQHRAPAPAAAAASAAPSPLAQQTHAVINELLESGLLQRRERAGNGSPKAGSP